MVATISMGLRKNFRMSRSMMAMVRYSFIGFRPYLPSRLTVVQVADVITRRSRQGIAQLPAGVMKKDVIERGALDADRLTLRGACWQPPSRAHGSARGARKAHDAVVLANPSTSAAPPNLVPFAGAPSNSLATVGAGTCPGGDGVSSASAA